MSDFYTGAEAAQRYGEIIPVYQAAFAGPPWNEVSECVDTLSRCPGGIGATAIGMQCELCLQCPTEPAYADETLRNRFDDLSNSRPVSWYLEESEQGLALAALAWPADAAAIAAEKYADVPAMQAWLTATFGDRELIWLDEVFADRTKRSSGNLRNFGAMCVGFGDRLSGDLLAYRTIAPQMLAAPRRAFGDQARLLTDIPDRRTLVTINLAGART